MITYRNFCKYAFSLVMVMFIGISTANGQTLTDYAKKHKAERASKQKIEKEAYDAACIKGTIDALKAFVNNYPKSKYASEAKSKIRNLELKIEKDAYDSACKTSTLDAFRSFLKKYPKSQYAKDVQNRIKDFDLWTVAKKNNTIQAYNSYLQHSQYKTFTKEAKAAIEDITAVSEWQNIKTTTNLAEVQAYIKKYSNASCISEAKKKEHELKGVQYYNNGNLASAYREFTEAGGKYALSYNNRSTFDKCLEYHDFSLLSSYSTESELSSFLKKYPNSPELKIYLAFSLSMINRISKDENEKKEAVKKAVQLCTEVIDSCGDNKQVDSALDMLTRIYIETGNFVKAEEAISKISADRYRSRIVGMVNMLASKKCFVEQEQLVEESLWKLYWTMSRVFECMTHSYMTNKEYEKAITFCDAHEKLLSIFDCGCSDFYATYKIFVCENKAKAYMKMGDKEKCLAELKRFFVLAKQVKSVAQSSDFNIAVRNPMYFSNISEEIGEEYMPNIYPEKAFNKYDAFFGEDKAYIQFKESIAK